MSSPRWGAIFLFPDPAINRRALFDCPPEQNSNPGCLRSRWTCRPGRSGGWLPTRVRAPRGHLRTDAPRPEGRVMVDACCQPVFGDALRPRQKSKPRRLTRIGFPRRAWKPVGTIKPAADLYRHVTVPFLFKSVATWISGPLPINQKRIWRCPSPCRDPLLGT